ncbi:pyruvate:ferredoxin (flavodoxin) oxidoreductase [Sporomusa sp. KB1]|jgi:pyruvate-ferredoxin/flavodoxin oxidoreductase|uniref:pyruvate:ferredoxin (flavodoxin) oxidoreductase n=1 Tax=Sporomusa sp. KB1 TaxID=943346 RepID=UPI0011A0608E|nr:pyruvate:ferredoxin (flavodoxin) oxidoreductase [Sporomusa sp. KB1]TWH46456.1 pyruvate-ferredoxin/flavodoxin oxidoreductase [Sporomusa sp. KB1]
MKRRMKMMDGNTAAAHISYAFTDVAAIFPITPSSNMAESVDEWVAQGRKNIFGQTVEVVEMQSEGGAAGAVHGSLQAGALTTTYTASQGLLLMIPNMYKIAGELLPGVFHVSARVVGANAISIFGDHSDVMATRQTGFALLAESSVQQVMDLSAVAHLSAIKGKVPFLNFFDGFRTSHEIQKVEILEYEELASLLDRDALDEFRRKGLNPDHPALRGTVQNSDIYFQQREVTNRYYQALPEIVEEYMGEITKLTGREYHTFNYYGAKDADRMIIAMGSMCEAIEEVVDYLNANGEKVGLLTVHLYRPFSIKHFFKYIPKTVQKIAVLDRTKEMGSLAEPLYLDVKTAFYNSGWHPVIVGGRCGVGGKDVVPRHIQAVYENLRQEQPKDNFTIGIVDDVTYTSLSLGEDIDTTPTGTKACKFWGLGSDGTVGANKSAIKIIGDHTELYAQAYFAYDSKKSGGVTISHLRFGKQPIKAPYLINKADFIACHNQSYVDKYNVLDGLKKGGNFLLNCTWNEREVDENLPAAMKRFIFENNINFYTIDAVGIAREIGLGGRINMIMQAAFFKIAGIIPVDEAANYLKEAVEKSYGKKGEKIVAMNNAAIDRGVNSSVKFSVPASWGNAQAGTDSVKEVPAFIENILKPMNRQEGDALPVSAFISVEDGTFPLGTAAYEKRGIAINVPEWQMDECIQCNQCAYVCPHAAIRPILADEDEIKKAPAGFTAKPATGVKDMNFRMAISPLDCTGCGNCAQICPAKEKALVMKALTTQFGQAKLWDYAMLLAPKPNPLKKETVKGSQFEQPLLEFSGACAGCGETPYAKLVTQLFGDRMMVANATGCSSVWAGSAPSVPYTKNHRGHGPAWGNSLFEDNAEFGLGMLLGVKQVRNKLIMDIEKAAQLQLGEEFKKVCNDWLVNKDAGEGTRDRADKLIEVLERARGNDSLLNEIYKNRDFLVKRSQWIFGGDGWAYDIGFGGLDHVLASGENVNVLVFDTEVYSNTGGQSSKATPTAAIAKFAASGKRTKKKDLGMIAMSYGYVYVAQIAMGADKNQTLKAIAEAEAYPGPSLIIAYAPCINHGLKVGMGCSQLEAKRAVDSGYWALYRYNPQAKDAGNNPFTMDSKEATTDFKDFLMGEVRYSSLQKQFPDIADALFEKTKQDAKERWEKYRQLADR